MGYTHSCLSTISLSMVWWPSVRRLPRRRPPQSLVRAKATLVPGADERFGRMDPKERELQVLALAPSGATSRRGGATLTNLQVLASMPATRPLARHPPPQTLQEDGGRI